MKNMLRKALAGGICVILATTMVLSGCGGSDSEEAVQSSTEQTSTSTGTGSSSDTQVKIDPASLKASISYWGESNPNFVDANKQIIKKFNETYPNVKIKYTQFPYDSFSEKLKASYAAGSASDMQQIFGDWAGSLMKNGKLEPVPDDLATDAKNKYYEAPLGGYTYDGKLYGIPREFNIENGGVLYYPDKLKSAGYNEFPKTYDELLEAAKKLTKYDTKGEPIEYGFDFMTSDNIPYMFLSFILQQGGTYWDTDKVHVKFTTPEAKKAITAMMDLVVKDKVTEIKHLEDANNEAHVVFFKGKSAMCFRGPWVIATGLTEYNLSNFSYGSMPSFTGESKAFAAESGWGEIVSAASKNKEAVWEYIKFATNAENNALFNNRSYTIPADKSIAESAAFLEKNPLMKVSVEVLPNGVPIGYLGSLDQFKITVVSNHFSKLVTGKEDVDTALAGIEKETNKLIDQN